jgi:hypothetical protein
MNLKEDGIDISLALAGLFGALMTTTRTSGAHIGKSILSLVGGAASANYLTPLLMHISKLENDTHYAFAVAFLLGFAGLRVVDAISSKFLTPNESTYRNKRHR